MKDKKPEWNTNDEWGFKLRVWGKEIFALVLFKIRGK